MLKGLFLHFTYGVLFIISTFVFGQSFSETILQPEGSIGSDDLFGDCVSMEEDFAFVGAPWDESNGSFSGKIYIFKQDEINGTWPQFQVLGASDAASGDRFGASIATENDYLVTGAIFDQFNGDEKGSAYLFRLMEDQWIEVAKLLPSDILVTKEFGASVDIEGDRIAVGAPAHFDKTGYNVGAAYVFERQIPGNDSNWIETQILMSSDIERGDHFGRSVAIWGNILFVSAIEDDDLGVGSGSVYVFCKDTLSGVWEEQGKLTASDGHGNHLFGISIILEEDKAFIGASTGLGSDLPGDVYIFEYDESSQWWLERAKLNASDSGELNFFGYSLNKFGDTLIVGAFYSQSEDLITGAAYLFAADDEEWIEFAKLVPSNGEDFDWFGFAVASNANSFLVGAPMSDAFGTSSGAAYIYQDDATNIVNIPAQKPDVLELEPNFPNPFNTTTTVDFSVPRTGMVTLAIYSIHGQRIRTLIHKKLNSGKYEVSWDGMNDSGHLVASGIYFYRLRLNESARTRKLVFTQ